MNQQKQRSFPIYWLFYCLAICFLSTNLKAQAIHDAEELRAFLTEDYQLTEGDTEEQKEQFYQLLARNLSDSMQAQTLDKAEILNAYRNNPFIGELIPETMGSAGFIDFDKNGSRGGLLDAASTGLGLPTSTFVLGLADFLVERTKQELSIAFFRDFQKIIKESKEMKMLFPSTSKVLLEIDKNIYQFKAFWEVLRESFLSDLNNLVYNLDDYIQNSDVIKNHTLRYLASDLFKVVELFYDQEPPAKIIEYLAKEAYLHTITPDMDTAKYLPILKGGLELLGAISSSLEHKDGNGYWTEPEKITKLIRKPILGVLYLGLLYEKHKSIKLGDKTLGAHLSSIASDKTKSKFRVLLNTFKVFLDKGQLIKRLAESIRDRANERRRNKNAQPKTDEEKQLEEDDYFRFTEGICDLIAQTYELKKALVGYTSKEDTLVKKYLSIVSDLNSLGLDIRKKHYTSALVNALFVIQKLLPEDEFACKRQVLLKYGTFIATAVQAKTPQEVSDAIAAFALPPGGSAIKKYSDFSIALNAYVGVSAGQEMLMGVGDKAFYAVATPIGVTFSYGFGNYGSLSVLASLIDIGALTAFRFQDSTVNELPDLRFENILAPGGYLVYGVPKYPISIGIGAQLGPNLRSVTNGTLNSTTSGWRWGAFIAVDIPMVSIYSSNQNYKVCRKRSRVPADPKF